MKDASWGRLFQVEGTAKVGENMTSLGQMQGVSSLEPWRGILLTLRVERPDLQDLREPDSLNIRKCNRRTLKSLSTAIMLITIPLAIEAEQKAQD